MSGKLYPPGPRGHLLSGNLPEFRRDRLAFMRACAREFGDVVRLRFGPRRVYLVNHPDLIEDVLVTHNQNFIKHFALRLNPVVLGNGLLTSEGEFWRQQRRRIQPAFHRSRLAGFADCMTEYTEQMLDSWRDGETRDVLTEMSHLTLRIAARTLFDADVAGEARAVGEAMEVAQARFLERFNSLVPLPAHWPTPGNLRLKRAVRRLDEIIYGFIRQRRAAGADRGDLLSLLLAARDEDGGGRMSDQQLRDEAMTLFLAGHETTALTLAWTWHELARDPDAEARLVAELEGALGDRPITVDDLPRLAYLEAVVNESLRLNPPGYTIGREAVADCELGGFQVPAGTTLLMSQWVVHRDARFFNEPEAFRPERWTEGLAHRLPKYAFFPFGGGPRLCIGNTFAMMEAMLILAVIARRFRFTLVPGPPVAPHPTFTLRPARAITAVLSRRQSRTPVLDPGRGPGSS